jgi:DNA invertase Pin-like site-specific DNA recombinase
LIFYQIPDRQLLARRAYGYCKVSTNMQRDSGINLDEQQRKIKARYIENGWHLERVFVDAGVSGETPLGQTSEGRGC